MDLCKSYVGRTASAGVLGHIPGLGLKVPVAGVSEGEGRKLARQVSRAGSSRKPWILFESFGASSSEDLKQRSDTSGLAFVALLGAPGGEGKS